MRITSQKFIVRIIGKRESSKGWWIFKKPKYDLTFETADFDLTEQVSDTREVAYEKFCQVQKGDRMLLTLYRADGDTKWYYSERELQLAYCL